MDGVIDRQALESQISQLEYYLEQARKMLAIADEMEAIGNGAPDRSGKPKKVRKGLRDLQSNLLTPPNRPKLSKPKPVMESAVNSPRKIIFTQASMSHKRMVKILERYRADRGISNAMFARMLGVNYISHMKIMKLDQNVTEAMFERYLKLIPELESISPKGRFGRKAVLPSVASGDSRSSRSSRSSRKDESEEEGEVPSIFDEEEEREEKSEESQEPREPKKPPKPKKRRGRPPAKASKAEEEPEEDEEDEEDENAGENEEHEEDDDEFEPVTPTIVYEGESEEEEE